MKLGKIAVLVVLLATAAYFFTQGGSMALTPSKGSGTPAAGGTDFEIGLSRLNAVWENHGVNASAYDFRQEKLATLRAGEAAEIKAGLQAEAVGLAGGALKDLAGIHLALADIAAAEQKLSDASKEIDAIGFSEYCQHIDSIRNRNQLLAARLGLLKDYQANYGAFRAAYPGEATEAGLSGPLGLDIGALKTEIAGQKGTVSMLETTCVGAA